MTKEVKAFIEKLISDAITKDIFIECLIYADRYKYNIDMNINKDLLVNINNHKYIFHYEYSTFFNNYYLFVLDDTNKLKSTIKIRGKYFRAIKKLYKDQLKRRNIENLINSDPSLLRKQKLDKINELNN